MYTSLYEINGTTLVTCNDKKLRGAAVIPQGITVIGSDAFAGCVFLTSVVIPPSVCEIGEDAFWGCKSITALYIPDAVTHIGEDALARCKGLAEISLPARFAEQARAITSDSPNCIITIR